MYTVQYTDMNTNNSCIIPSIYRSKRSVFLCHISARVNDPKEFLHMLLFMLLRGVHHTVESMLTSYYVFVANMASVPDIHIVDLTVR
jgi:hypothetical protein